MSTQISYPRNIKKLPTFDISMVSTSVKCMLVTNDKSMLPNCDISTLPAHDISMPATLYISMLRNVNGNLT